MKNTTVRVKMLGNFRAYGNGQEYDLPVQEANELTGLGIAVIVDKQAAPAAKGEDRGL